MRGCDPRQSRRADATTGVPGLLVRRHGDVAILASPGGLTPRACRSLVVVLSGEVAILASPGGLTPHGAASVPVSPCGAGCDPRQPRRADATVPPCRGTAAARGVAILASPGGLTPLCPDCRPRCGCGVAILASPGGLTPHGASAVDVVAGHVAILASPGGLTPLDDRQRLRRPDHRRCDPRQPRRADATDAALRRPHPRERRCDPRQPRRADATGRARRALSARLRSCDPRQPRRADATTYYLARTRAEADQVAILASPGGLTPQED